MKNILFLVAACFILAASSCNSFHNSTAKLHDLKLVKRDAKEVVTKKNKIHKALSENSRAKKILAITSAPNNVSKTIHKQQISEYNSAPRKFKTKEHILNEAAVSTEEENSLINDNHSNKKRNFTGLLLLGIGLFCLAMAAIGIAPTTFLKLAASFIIGAICIYFLSSGKKKDKEIPKNQIKPQNIKPTEEKSSNFIKATYWLVCIGFALLLLGGLLILSPLFIELPILLALLGGLLLCIGLIMASRTDNKVLKTLSIIFFTIGGIIGTFTLLFGILKSAEFNVNFF